MKKLLFPLFILLFFFACEKDDSTEIVFEESTYENGSATTRGEKRDVCHNGHIINISVNAIPAHQGHGDAVDMDGDGYFDMENDCGMPVDCDDSVYDPENSCCEGYEIDFEGVPLFVALEDEVGTYDWQGAINACADKAEADGCGWYLPNLEELAALYDARYDIGGFNTLDFSDSHYWSSIERNVDVGWGQIFRNGDLDSQFKVFENQCRCVRK